MSPGRRTRSVRTRVLTWVLVLAALGMAVAGATSYALQDERLHREVDAGLAQEVREFRALATDGVDPATGSAFTSVEQLLAVVLQRNVPDSTETHLTLFGGEVAGTRVGEQSIALHDEPHVLDVIRQVPRDAGAVITEAETARGTVRMIVVQVGVQGRPTSGTYVVAAMLDQRRAELADLTRIYVVMALVALVVVGIGGWIVAGHLLRPLRLLREAAAGLDESQLDQRIPVRGDDDVSELTQSFNAMLDRLQGAFGSQRQLIDDAGHELRTPLTIVSGHLQLLDPDDSAAVAETRDLLLDETDRMSRLVEDLIVLATSQRSDFVQLEPLEVADLTDEMFGKARALGDRQWVLGAIGEGHLVGDRQRIVQAVLALAQNAVKYSAPGSRVTVSSEVARGEARFRVTDQGLGIDPDDLDRIFRRFGPGRLGPRGRGVGPGAGHRRCHRPGARGLGRGRDRTRRRVDLHRGAARPAGRRGSPAVARRPGRDGRGPVGRLARRAHGAAVRTVDDGDVVRTVTW